MKIKIKIINQILLFKNIKIITQIKIIKHMIKIKGKQIIILIIFQDPFSPNISNVKPSDDDAFRNFKDYVNLHLNYYGRIIRMTYL